MQKMTMCYNWNTTSNLQRGVRGALCHMGCWVIVRISAPSAKRCLAGALRLQKEEFTGTLLELKMINGMPCGLVDFADTCEGRPQVRVKRSAWNGAIVLRICLEEQITFAIYLFPVVPSSIYTSVETYFWVSLSLVV